MFKAPRGGMLSDMTLAAVLRRMDVPAVPHGFRSTFRDWAAERTTYPRDVAEMALAHAIGNAVEAAYRRGDLFEKRTDATMDPSVMRAVGSAWRTTSCACPRGGRPPGRRPPPVAPRPSRSR